MICHSFCPISDRTPLSGANYHLGLAVYISASNALCLMATADASGRAVFLHLRSGAFVGLFRTEKVWGVLIVDDGFIAVCEGWAIDVSTTGDRRLCEFRSEAEVSAWCPIESVGASSLIAVAF
jgi:hypothetical protein